MENKDLDEKNWKKTDYNIFEYFWSNSIFSIKDERNLPYFLKKIDIFKDFSELELFDLVDCMHIRNFSTGEQIITDDKYGIGFYLVVSGSLELKSKNKGVDHNITLYPKMHFGERNLLLDHNKSNITVAAKEKSVLAAILIPDLDNLIDKKPRIAVKLIKTLSKISLSRLNEIEKHLDGGKWYV